MFMQCTSGFYSGSGQIHKLQVLNELKFTQGQKEDALQADPYNTINILQQVGIYFLQT